MQRTICKDWHGTKYVPKPPEAQSGVTWKSRKPFLPWQGVAESLRDELFACIATRNGPAAMLFYQMLTSDYEERTPV